MAFIFPQLSSFKVDKARVAARADRLDISLTAKERWAAAARAEVFDALCSLIEHQIEDAVALHTVIEGGPEDFADDPRWQTGLYSVIRTAFSMVPQDIISEHLIGPAVWEYDIACKSAAGVAEALMPELEPGHEGKYLSALGLVASDYETAPAETVSSTLGIDPMPPRYGTKPDVTQDEITRAYKLFKAATDVDSEKLAKILGVSRPTLGNYLASRTKPPIDRNHAQSMRVEIERRMAEMMEAANLFAKVLS